MNSLLRFQPRFKLGGIPFAGSVFIGEQSTTTNETTTTFNFSLAAAPPHPLRVLVACGVGPGDVAGTCTFDGAAADVTMNNASRNICMFTKSFPTETDVDLALTMNVNAARKAIGLFAGYWASATPITSDDAQGLTTNPANCTPIDTVPGCSVIYVAACNAVLTTMSPNWSGADTEVEEHDAQIEATSTFCFGHVPLVTETLDDATMAISSANSATKRAWTLSIGP